MDCDLAEIVTSILKHWPKAILEKDELVTPLQEHNTSSWTTPCEFFVYEDQDSYTSWTEHGRTDENAMKMVSVSADPDNLHFTYDARIEPFMYDLMLSICWVRSPVRQQIAEESKRN